MKKLIILHNRIKSRSAVTALSYGLIAALITVVISGAVYETGKSINNVFSYTGLVFNYMSAQNAIEQYGLNTPNPALASWQQQEITNTLNEVTYGQASLSCLEALNGSDAPAMNNTMATCTPFNSEINLAPPSKPVRGIIYTGPNGQQWLAEIEQDGSVYMTGRVGNSPNSVIYFNDGYIDSTPGYSCNSPSNETGYGSTSFQDNLGQSPTPIVSCETPYTGYNNVGVLGGTGVMDEADHPLSISTFTPTNASAQNPLGVDSAFSF